MEVEALVRHQSQRGVGHLSDEVRGSSAVRGPQQHSLQGSDGLWDDLSLNGTIQCFGQNAKLPLATMEQDRVFNFWWSSCYDNLRGVGLSGIITGPIYANTFDYLTRATGVGNYCVSRLYGDPTC